MVSELELRTARTIPPSRASGGRPNAKPASEGDPDVRLTLSPAALRSAEVEGARDIEESAVPASTPTGDPRASESPLRRHPADAYRETPRAPRGERIRIVV